MNHGPKEKEEENHFVLPVHLLKQIGKEPRSVELIRDINLSAGQ